jgi:hypothetical protein
MRSFWLRLRTYWRRRRLARDFDDEIAFHLEMRRDRMIADGVPPDDANRAARRAFGSTLRTKEALAELWSFRWLDDLARDLLYAGRTCRRNPVFILTAVCSLALGIGAATAIYTAAYSLLWRPMPVKNPDRLVALYQTGPTGLEDFRSFSYPELLDYSRQVNGVDALAGSTGVPLRVTGGERPELVWGQVVTDNFFSTLQVDMAAGRGFLSGDRAPEAVLGYRFWQRRFNADPNVVGKHIGVNGHVLTIVGVTARGFTSTQLFNYVPDISVPVHLQPILLPGGSHWVEDRTNRWITMRGRLKPGVSLQQAETEFNVVARRLASQYPDTNRGRLLGALAAGRLLGQIVAGVSGTDPATYLVVVFLTFVVGAIAALLPARRAAAVDPVRALHWE